MKNNELTEFVKSWQKLDDQHIANMAPHPKGIKANYEVDFDLSGKVKTFYRSEVSAEKAVASAQTGFQWTYGSWPGEPLAVREVAS